jgi:protein regulator of cytokinesis 1
VCKFLYLLGHTIVPYEPCSVCSGLVDPSELLANIEEQIVKSKEEAVGRREIMDRIDRWLSACEEENWLEDYNQVSWNIVVLVFPCA